MKVSSIYRLNLLDYENLWPIRYKRVKLYVVSYFRLQNYFIISVISLYATPQIRVVIFLLRSRFINSITTPHLKKSFIANCLWLPPPLLAASMRAVWNTVLGQGRGTKLCESPITENTMVGVTVSVFWRIFFHALLTSLTSSFWKKRVNIQWYL